MTSLSRRRFAQLALGTPLVMLGADKALANPVEAKLSQAYQPRFPGEIWVLVDDREAALTIFNGSLEQERFAPISLGRGRAKPTRLSGSNVTPMGEFRVNRFNFDSKFHIFIGLDYPTPTHARAALEEGVFTQRDFDDYFHYYRRHGYPPQDTVLGGFIGLHGVGEGDPDIHRQFHWTQGCVAVTDAEIELLADLIGIGTRVVIR